MVTWPIATFRAKARVRSRVGAGPKGNDWASSLPIAHPEGSGAREMLRGVHLAPQQGYAPTLGVLVIPWSIAPPASLVRRDRFWLLR